MLENEAYAAKPLLNEDDTAKKINVKKPCLRRWRRELRNLPFVKVGRLVRYRPEDIERFIREHTQNVTPDEMSKESREREVS